MFRLHSLIRNARPVFSNFYFTRFVQSDSLWRETRDCVICIYPLNASMGVILQRNFKLTSEQIIMNTIAYRSVTHYGSVETVSTLRTTSSGSSEGWWNFWHGASEWFLARLFLGRLPSRKTFTTQKERSEKFRYKLFLVGLFVRGLPSRKTFTTQKKVRKNSDTNPCLFGSKRIEVMRNWSKLHSQELHDLQPLPKIIRVFKYGRWDGHGKWHYGAGGGGKESCIQGFVGKHEGKRTFVRSRCRW